MVHMPKTSLDHNDELVTDEKKDKDGTDGKKDKKKEREADDKEGGDEDGDGDWTPGNFYSSRQPEKVIVNRDQISVRANWTIQIKWEIDN